MARDGVRSVHLSRGRIKCSFFVHMLFLTKDRLLHSATERSTHDQRQSNFTTGHNFIILVPDLLRQNIVSPSSLGTLDVNRKFDCFDTTVDTRNVYHKSATMSSPTSSPSRSSSISSISSMASTSPSSLLVTPTSLSQSPSSKPPTTSAPAHARRPSIQFQGHQVPCTDREAQLYFLMGFKTSGFGGLG